jgi:hypothetical protein
VLRRAPRAGLHADGKPDDRTCLQAMTVQTDPATAAQAAARLIVAVVHGATTTGGLPSIAAPDSSGSDRVRRSENPRRRRGAEPCRSTVVPP